MALCAENHQKLNNFKIFHINKAISCSGLKNENSPTAEAQKREVIFAGFSSAASRSTGAALQQVMGNEWGDFIHSSE